MKIKEYTNEIKTAKEELERSIKDLVSQFEFKTGLDVESIDVQPIKGVTGVGEITLYKNIDIKLDI